MMERKMEITRTINGEDIVVELTANEIAAAFVEHEKYCAYQDLMMFLKDAGINTMPTQQQIDNIIWEYLESMDESIDYGLFMKEAYSNIMSKEQERTGD